jgi:DNA repair exonuclease SbcCD nuclease subunit
MSLRVLGIALLLLAPMRAASPAFRFVILGDRTGEARTGVFEEALREAAAEEPAFVVSVGDLIEGLNDATVEGEWRALDAILAPFRRYPFYVASGNHDVWSQKSEECFRRYAGRPFHYSFDYRQAHVTVLDNSRTDPLPADEMAFLEKDLAAHAAQAVKCIVSHRPSWVLNVIVRNPEFPLHQLAKRYGVQAVIAGHIHEMLHVTLDGVEYISMPSSGGHLRLAKRYEDGWFYGYALVTVTGKAVEIQIKELKPPYGRGRVTAPEDWGAAGLVDRTKAEVPASK